ncbi:hypothetical protein P4O66_022724 [Electrophorus voltai]|uniref:Xenotropic and polytropic retrovirus receptor 1 n=1 Tax=Electrophorus voltai TaxID=2609070 RepID=A0AAD8ZLC6_9TELE|nr:hypothetical protein P4O66_022724 [Electrophorus voltai]
MKLLCLIVTDEDTVKRYFAKFEEKFFQTCEKELSKINTFYSALCLQRLTLADGQGYIQTCSQHCSSKRNSFAPLPLVACSITCTGSEYLHRGQCYGTEKLAEAQRRFATLQNELQSSLDAQRENSAPGLRHRRKTVFPLSNEERNQHRNIKDLKLAFSEFYLSLILLQNYQNLNFTGFRKILKKHDKILETTRGADWRVAHVEVAPFYTCKKITQLISETETLVTTELEEGDRQKAMKRLRVPPLGAAQPAPAWTTFRVGLFCGIFVVLTVAFILSGAVFFRNKNIWPMVRMYRGGFLLIQFLFLLGINTYGWRQAGVNHVLIFELNPRNNLSHQHLFEIYEYHHNVCYVYNSSNSNETTGSGLCVQIAGFLGVLWCGSILSCLYADYTGLPMQANPLILYTLMFLFLINPIKTAYYKSRFWLLKLLLISTVPGHKTRREVRNSRPSGLHSRGQHGSVKMGEGGVEESGNGEIGVGEGGVEERGVVENGIGEIGVGEGGVEGVVLERVVLGMVNINNNSNNEYVGNNNCDNEYVGNNNSNNECVSDNVIMNVKNHNNNDCVGNSKSNDHSNNACVDYNNIRITVIMIVWVIVRFRVSTAPFHRVEFADFWLADQLNSLVFVLMDLEYLVCYYSMELQWGEVDGLLPHTEGDGKCQSYSYGLRAIIHCLPAWFRFIQCLRRYRDTKRAFPHLVNAGKYSTTFFVVAFAALYSTHKKQNYVDAEAFFILLVIFSTINSLYTLIWDLKMDWGLFDRNAGEHTFLREEIVYPQKAYYYCAIVEDVILRFAWTLQIALTTMTDIHDVADILTTILAPLEVFRRFVWNFFRLENEHLNNCGEFRAVRDISVAPLNADDQTLLEQMMDQEDGVRHRQGKKQWKRSYSLSLRRPLLSTQYEHTP